MYDFERSNDGRIGGNAVETNIGIAVVDEGEEIGVSAVAGDLFVPRGAPAEDDGAFDGDVEAGGIGLAVVVVIDGESTDEVAAIGEGRDEVAVLLAGGDGEEAEVFLVVGAEAERFRDDGGVAGGEEAVGEPWGVELVGGVGESAAVYVI